MKKQTVVVTGSQGFIGGYLVQELLDQGYHVVGVDNYSKYGIVKKNHDNHPNFEFIEEDLAKSNSKMIKGLVGAQHLIAGAAKIGGISYFHTYAYDLLADNERIMANTCDAAIKVIKNGELKKVTYLSSSMVYENTNSWPSNEGDELKIPPPSSAYGFQKLAVEYFARAAWDQYQIPFTIIRVFNCIGVGEARAINSKSILSGNIELAMSHVLPDLIQKILKGQNPLRILGSGNQIRHLTYGKDLARGIVMSLDNTNATNQDFNISTNEAVSVLTLAEMIWNKIHKGHLNFDYVSENSFPYDVQKRIPNTEKALKILGFEANTPLEKVVDEVIEWVKEAIEKKII